MRKINAILFCTIFASVLWGCSKEYDRSACPREDVVTLFYGAGFNDLSSDLTKNLKTILKGEVPFSDSKHKLLAYTHLTRSNYNYTPNGSQLVRYSKENGAVITDTLIKFDASRTACDPEVLKEVLLKIDELYPGTHCGIIFSSHATGWLPAGRFSSAYKPRQFSAGRPLPFYRYEEIPQDDGPRVKTFGAEVLVDGNNKYSQEMSIQSMAKAIPMHLDYIIFDACLMGGVEVAYELKDVADLIAFSPTEVLSDGFDYSAVSRLINDKPDAKAFCEAYYDLYDRQSDQRYRSATITLIKTAALERLAQVSKSLFAKYRSGLDALGTLSGVQEYFRNDKHWFYDLRDILVKAGADASDLADFDAALDECIAYKATTEHFLEININTYSGLSMYLPGAARSDSGVDELDDFYRTLAWNKATNLVE